MRLINTIIALAAIVITTSCNIPEDEKRSYAELTTLDGTMWYSYDQRENIYYDIWYDGEGRGRMLGYDSSERTNEVVNRPFDYAFTLATDEHDAIVDLTFDDKQRYGGILIPKGNLKINNKDVYVIQLYELTADGSQILYDENGNIASTLQMWME